MGAPRVCETRPGSHKVQVAGVLAPRLVLYVPAWQAVQLEREDKLIPVAYVPVGHKVQLAWLPRLKLPGSHLEQLVKPSVLAYNPAPHRMHCDCPAAGWMLATGQRVHTDWLPRLKEPGLHNGQVMVWTAEANVPWAHSRHLVCPTADW